MTHKDVKKGLRAEKRKAKSHHGRHIGGPGKPDYTRGKVKGEVKNRKTKVTKPELKKQIKKGIKEVDSKAGFTKPAIEYRNKYHRNVKLIKKNKKL